jgi:hypothetical protein
MYCNAFVVNDLSRHEFFVAIKIVTTNVMLTGQKIGLFYRAEPMRRFLVCLLLVLLCTCAHLQSTTKIEPNQKFDLKFHDTAFFQTEALAIRFSSVIQDSRCPKGVQCITAGNATIELMVRKSNQKETAIQLNTDSGPNEVVYDTYKIRLVELNPYPVSGEQRDLSHYIATLLITTA